MRVLLLSTYDSGGGAAVATHRLQRALQAIGLQVRMLCLHRSKQGEDIAGYYQGRWGACRAFALKAYERADIIRHNGFVPKPLWQFSSASVGVDISQHPWVAWADVIHLHWVNQGFLSMQSLASLQALTKPLVWTLHDLWAVTGGCHIPLSFGVEHTELCSGFEGDCSACPLLAKRGQAYAQHLHQSKRILHQAHNPIHYIAVSRGMAELFGRSSLHRGLMPAKVIPPALAPLPSSTKPTSLDLSWHKPTTKYILTAAARLEDAVKGLPLLLKVCEGVNSRLAKGLSLGANDKVVPRQATGYNFVSREGNTLSGEGVIPYEVEFLLVGELSPDKALPKGVRPLGRLGAEALAYLYTHIADITLSTSLFESFGQTLTESLSCGKPVVAFRACGPEDIIQHGTNGYLADAYDTEQMAGLILRLLAEQEAGLFSPEVCRQSVEAFRPEAVAEAHRAVYAEIVVNLLG